MTISPCSQRPTNCCVVKLRWNAAPALSISERESSPLWLPLNSGKSFCQSQRGAGEPTCCTRLKSIAMDSKKYRPSMMECLSSLRAAASSAAEPASWAAPATYYYYYCSNCNKTENSLWHSIRIATHLRWSTHWSRRTTISWTFWHLWLQQPIFSAKHI